MGNSQRSHPFWEVWTDSSGTRVSPLLRLWGSGKRAFFSREFLENSEVCLRRNLVSPNPKTCCFHYLKVNLRKKRVGHLRFSWQSGTLMGQSYYKWIVISLLKRMVRFLHPSSCFSFSFPSDFSLDIQTISDTYISWKLKVYSYWRDKKKKNWYIFSGHILWCCGAACFRHTVLIWFKSKLLWLNTLWPAQMQSVFFIIAFRLPSYQHTSATLMQAFCFQSSS